MKKSPMPTAVSPMLATLTKKPVTAEGYIHEIKFDGYRIIAFVDKGKVTLRSRGGLDYTSKYPAVVNALKKAKYRAVLDGEICALDEKGLPDFGDLQKPTADSHLVYYVFDILWLNGENLMEVPLLERKTILEKTIGRNEMILYSMHFPDAMPLFDQMKAMGMEGIVSKKADSEYLPGTRSNFWLKTPTEIRQEFVIGGWVESDHGRPFASLLIGAYKNGKLHWVGRSGGGFKEKEMPGILKQLQAIEVKKSPFANEVEKYGVLHFTKPVLVANFKFTDWTKSGRIRKPAIFLGFRTDKKAKDVVIEKGV